MKGTVMGMLQFLSNFDWISPTIGLECALSGDGPISIHWGGKPPIYYERLLEKSGVKVTSRTVVGGKGFVMTVPAEDKERARKILKRAGASLA